MIAEWQNLVFSVTPLLLKAAWTTIQISLLAIIIGSFFGGVMGIISCNKLRICLLNRLIATYVTIIRGTPLFVQLLIIYFALPETLGIDLSPFSAGVLSLGINSTAYLAETMRGGINSIPSGQWEACKTLGYSTFQTLRFIILPQAIRNVLPALTNEFVSLIKESSILMILGVPELTKVSKDIVARELKPMEIYSMTALLYFAMTSIVSKISQKWEGASHGNH